MSLALNMVLAAVAPAPVYPPAGHVKDFGYYYSMSPHDHLDAVAGHCTTAFVYSGGADVSAVAMSDIAQIQRLRARNMTAILFSIGNVVGSQAKLKTNYSDEWKLYWSLVEPHKDAILAFYPFDEPTQEQVSSGRYGRVTKLIKASAPDIPIAATLTPSFVHDISTGAQDLPPEVDWVSYDNYGCWGEEECAAGHCCWQKIPVTRSLGILRDFAAKRGGKTFVVPDAVAGAPASTRNFSVPDAEQAYRAARFLKYMAWCEQEPSCVAALPFLWNTVHSRGEWLIGAGNQPTLLQTIKPIGERIKMQGASHGGGVRY